MTRWGYYGKIPALGDFVEHGLARDFVQPWDAWLQRLMTDSRDSLGEDWLERYLSAPLWRFALAPGVAGPQAMAGLLMASVDRVGRYFPLTVATPAPPGDGPATALAALAALAPRLEDVAVAMLEDAPLDALDAALADVGPLSPTDARVREGPAGLEIAAGHGLTGPVLADLGFAGRSVLWLSTSDEGERMLACDTLPEGSAAEALLGPDGVPAPPPFGHAGDLPLFGEAP